MYDTELDGTRRLLTIYLSATEPGPWTIENACISARGMPGRGLPADARSVRVLVEEPDQGWSVVIEAAYRSGKLWRTRIASYHDDRDAHGGAAGVARAYADWLTAL